MQLFIWSEMLFQSINGAISSTYLVLPNKTIVQTKASLVPFLLEMILQGCRQLTKSLFRSTQQFHLHLSIA